MSADDKKKFQDEYTRILRKGRSRVGKNYFYYSFLPMAVVSNLSIRYLLQRGTIRLGTPSIAYGAATIGSYFFSEYLAGKAWKKEAEKFKTRLQRKAKA